jgi:hypothetical protein
MFLFSLHLCRFPVRFFSLQIKDGFQHCCLKLLLVMGNPVLATFFLFSSFLQRACKLVKSCRKFPNTLIMSKGSKAQAAGRRTHPSPTAGLLSWQSMHA